MQRIDGGSMLGITLRNTVRNDSIRGKIMRYYRDSSSLRAGLINGKWTKRILQ